MDFETLQDNAELISAGATVLMTIAWVTYAQFAIMTYVRQRRPRIMIDQTADHSLNTRFVIVNLSEMPVYISGILVCVRREDGEETTHKIENYQRFSGSTDDDGEEPPPEQIEDQLRHGTLDAGDLFLIGSSAETLSWLLSDEDEESASQPRGQRLKSALADIDFFEFRVVAMVGTSDHSAGSSRSFGIEYDENDEVRIVPRDPSTKHYASWWNRATAEEWSRELREHHL